MNILNSIFCVVLTLGLLACDSKSSPKVETHLMKGTGLIDQLNSMSPTMETIAITDIRTTTAEERNFMRKTTEEYLNITEQIIELSASPDIEFSDINIVKLRKDFALKILALIDNYETKRSIIN